MGYLLPDSELLLKVLEKVIAVDLRKMFLAKEIVLLLIVLPILGLSVHLPRDREKVFEGEENERVFVELAPDVECLAVVPVGRLEISGQLLRDSENRVDKAQVLAFDYGMKKEG